MQIRQLEYFCALAEELHFGRAAERLGMAQPPLSRQIKQMEEDLGALLFNRGRGTITMTLAGERLYEHATRILRDLEEAKLEVRRIGQGARGRLRIGFVGSATYGVLPTILKSFRAHFPEINLGLLPMNNAALHRGLVRRELDVAIARPAIVDAEVVTRPLVEEPLVLAAPDMLDLPDGSLSLTDLQDEIFVLYPEKPRPSFADVVLEAARAQGVELRNRMFTMDMQTALSLVAVGEGLSVVPQSVGRVARTGIRYRDISGPFGSTSLSVNYRIDAQSVHIKGFVDIAQRVARRMLEE